MPTLAALRQRGAWFTRAQVNFLPTNTAVGHSTLSTGTDPGVHGITCVSVWDRVNGRRHNMFEGGTPQDLMALTLADVWQLQTVQTGAGVPDELRWLGSGQFLEIVPNSLVVFVPLTVLILLLLRRTGYGRLLYAIGDNPIAARLSGARAWQVLIVLYVISAVLAAIAGLIVSGLSNTASVTLVDSAVLPSVAAAVIGGTSILGGRGGFGGAIVGALILTVLAALLTILGLPEPTRQIVFGSIIVVVAAAYTRVTAES